MSDHSDDYVPNYVQSTTSSNTSLPFVAPPIIYQNQYFGEIRMGETTQEHYSHIVQASRQNNPVFPIRPTPQFGLPHIEVPNNEAFVEAIFANPHLQQLGDETQPPEFPLENSPRTSHRSQRSRSQRRRVSGGGSTSNSPHAPSVLQPPQVPPPDANSGAACWKYFEKITNEHGTCFI